MPSLKEQLATLPSTTIEVVSNATRQEKSLDTLFLEQGFAAGANATQDGILPPCEACGCACCTDSCLPQCK
jgi:hypothetical protein